MAGPQVGDGFLVDTPQGPQVAEALRGPRNPYAVDVAPQAGTGAAGAVGGEQLAMDMSDEQLDAEIAKELEALGAGVGGADEGIPQPAATPPPTSDFSNMSDADLDAEIEKELGTAPPRAFEPGKSPAEIRGQQISPLDLMLGPAAVGTFARNEIEADQAADKYYDDNKISPEGAGTAARYNMGLAFGTTADPEAERAQLELILSKDLGTDVEVQMDPNTKEYVYKPSDSDQWHRIRGKNWNAAIGGLYEAMPELRSMLYGVGAGAAGGVGGASIPGAPVTAPAGAVLGSAIGEAIGEYERLVDGREQGLHNLSDADIYYMAAKRGAFTTMFGSLGVAGAAAFKNLVLRTYGIDKVPKEILRHTDEVGAGVDATEPLQHEVKALTGRELELSTGQAAGAPEALGSGRSMAAPEAGAVLRKGEGAARRSGRPELGRRLTTMRERNMATLDDLQRKVFLATDNEPVQLAGEAVQRAVRAHKAQSLASRDQRIVGAGRTREANRKVIELDADVADISARNFRDEIAIAREEIFRPFKAEYDLLARNAMPFKLAGIREAAEGILKKHSQEVIPSINLKYAPGAEGALEQLSRAGIKKPLSEEQELIFNIFGDIGRAREADSTLGEMMKVLEDINFALRREGLSDQGRNVFNQVRRAIQGEIDDQFPELAPDLAALRMAYRASIKQFDKGILGRIGAKDNYGNYNMLDDDALDYILSSPSAARQVQEALSGRAAILKGRSGRATRVVDDAPIENVQEIYTALQDSVLGRIYRQFLSGDKPDYAGIQKWLDSHGEQLDLIFHTQNTADAGLKSRVIPRVNERASLNEVRRLSSDILRLQERRAAAAKAFDQRFGYATADTNTIIRSLVQDNRVQELGVARRMVRRYLGQAGVDQFDIGLQAVAYRQMLGNGRRVTADAIDAWRRDPAGEAVIGILGDNWGKALNTYRDALRVVEQKIPADTSSAISDFFNKTPPQGISQRLMGFVRNVIFGPITHEGAVINQAQNVAFELNKQRISDILADPAALREFQRLSEIPLLTSDGKFSATARRLLGRLGFQYIDLDGDDGQE